MAKKAATLKSNGTWLVTLSACSSATGTLVPGGRGARLAAQLRPRGRFEPDAYLVGCDRCSETMKVTIRGSWRPSTARPSTAGPSKASIPARPLWNAQRAWLARAQDAGGRGGAGCHDAHRPVYRHCARRGHDRRATFSCFPVRWGADGTPPSDSTVPAGNYRFDPQTRLLYARQRYLHSGLGRWLTRDPQRGADGSEDGPNLYQYVGNNGLRWIDPEGLDKECCLAEKQVMENGARHTCRAHG